MRAILPSAVARPGLSPIATILYRSVLPSPVINRSLSLSHPSSSPLGLFSNFNRLFQSRSYSFLPAISRPAPIFARTLIPPVFAGQGSAVFSPHASVHAPDFPSYLFFPFLHADAHGELLPEDVIFRWSAPLTLSPAYRR